MSEPQNLKSIFNTLEEYSDKHGAHCYCILLFPDQKGEEGIISRRKYSTLPIGEMGLVIEKLVQKEILLPKVSKSE